MIRTQLSAPPAPEKQFELTQGQKGCIDFVLDNIETTPAVSIRGNAGVGKSTLFLELTKILRSKGKKVKTCALTHKAASLLCKAVPNTITVHSMFGLRPEIDYKTGTEIYKPLGKAKTEYGDIILVDESSMLSKDMFAILTAAHQTQNLRFIFFGDPYQLPPVHEELSPALLLEKSYSLTEVVRHDSEILELSTACCEAVKAKKRISISRYNNGANIQFVRKDEFNKRLIEDMKHAYMYGKHDTDYAKYVAWTNKVVERKALEIRKALGRSDIPEASEVVTMAAAYTKHDVVLYQNNEEVQLALVKEDAIEMYDHIIHGVHCTTTKFPQQKHFVATDKQQVAALLKSIAAQCSERKQWGPYYKVKNTFLPIAYPQASTVHKSQGSTYKKVYIDHTDLKSCSNPDVYARLLYVAVSRASESVYILK